MLQMCFEPKIHSHILKLLLDLCCKGCYQNMSSDFLKQIMAGAPAPKGVEEEVRSGTRSGLLGNLSSKKPGTSCKIIGLVYPPPRMPDKGRVTTDEGSRIPAASRKQTEMKRIVRLPLSY